MSDSRTNKITPNIELKDAETIEILEEILNYTALIRKLIGNKKKDELIMALKSGNILPKDLTLQHALIFCLKAIGTLIDNATDVEKISLDKLPTYWKNFHFLRNNLIHHCPTIEMPEKALELLAQLSIKVGQVYYYFYDWLRSLGDSRISAMHNGICIDTQRFATHIQEMIKLKKEMFLNNSFRSSFNILLSSEEKPEIKIPSNQNETVSNLGSGLFQHPQTMAQKLAASLNKSSLKPISSTASAPTMSSTTQTTINNKETGKSKKK